MNYAEGIFGHWWTVIEGNTDIAGQVYNGSIDAKYSNITSCKGMPKEIKSHRYLFGYTSLTMLPETLKVRCSLYLSGCMSLTALPKNLKVGNRLDLDGCTSLTTLPDNLNVEDSIFGDIYKWRGSTWSFLDSVKKEVKYVKKMKELTVYKMVDGTFAVYDGKYYSHGATLQEAKEDLIYKYSTCDLSKFESLKMNSVITFAEAVELYRSITGACSEGTRSFVESHGIDKSKSYTVAEIVERTEGQYNSEKIRQFFKGK